ncbi:MAG: hypothetical protein IJ455_02140 [Agathobacter sp.]|nr:hypothetical protein [Agathobacter sp.]
MNEREYRFAKTEEQVRKINKFLCISTAILNIISFIIIFVSYMRGYRTELYTFGLLAIMIVTSIGGFIIYKKNKDSVLLRYFMLTGLLIIMALLIYGFNSYYMRVLSVVPLMGCALFFDTRFAKISGIIVTVENFAITLFREMVLHDYKDEQFMDNITIAVVIMVMMFVLWYITKVGKMFNADSIDKAKHEADLQQEMMDDVLHIAEQVRTGTANAMGLMNDLQKSSEIVSSSVGDISTSTSLTAENIENQSMMTHNIQDNLEKTVARAENMVRVANRSNALNTESMKQMEQLSQESKMLAETNEVVADSMKQLQQNVNNVKEITKTIFDISSQTNLLALNASIESARAGEAGRGFAVVADEIRALSERTRQETENITQILGTLEENANETAKAVERSMEVGNVQEEMIAGVASQFGEMNANVNELAADVEEIEKMLENLSQANTEIVTHITQLSATTQEVTASAQQSSELTEENFRNSKEARDILDNILEVSHKMDKYLL